MFSLFFSKDYAFQKTYFRNTIRLSKKKNDSSSRLITPSLSSNCLSVDFKIGTCRQRVNIYFIYLIQHVLVGYEMVLMM